MSRISRFFHFLLALIPILIVGITGCTSFPKPTEEKSSLLVILYESIDERSDFRNTYSESISFMGPEKVDIYTPVTRHKLFIIPVRPGRYRMQDRQITSSSGYGSNSFRSGTDYNTIIVPADSIVLAPYIIRARLSGQWNYSGHTLSLIEADQQRIAEELTDTIGFSDWIGRLLIGFGKHTPRFTLRQDEYRLRLVSDPEGAEVIIDSAVVGTTPTGVDLRAGKHLVEVRKEGFSTWRNYIDVDSDNEIVIELKTVTADSGSDAAPVLARNQYGLVVTPFRNIGSGEHDYLQSVFDQSLSATFSQDKRIVVFRNPGDAAPGSTAAAGAPEARHETLKPDFGAAIKTGADLLIAGDYFARDENLLIHASLYDVQKESVKADILYTSKTGFSIFDSIDDMTAEFGAAVDKVLPESGREIIQKQEVVKSEITTMEKMVSQKDVIEKRNKKKHDLSLSFGMGAILDTVEPSAGGEDVTSRYGGGPGLGFGLGYTFHLFPFLGLNFAYTLTISPDYSSISGAFEHTFFAGPEFTFSGLLTDFYLRLLGQYRQAGEQTIFRESGSDSTIGPFYYYGLTVDTGIKYYLYRRYSSNAWYANLGFRFSPYLQRSTKNDFSEDITGVPLDMMIYTGLGVRL
jgi:hypothetical protein